MNATIQRYSAKPGLWETGPYKIIHRQLGDLAFQQLAELRHRGAFSTVSQTFSAWCVSCTKSTITEIKEWPKEFYNVSFPHIRGFQRLIDHSKLCLAFNKGQTHSPEGQLVCPPSLQELFRQIQAAASLTMLFLTFKLLQTRLLIRIPRVKKCSFLKYTR